MEAAATPSLRFSRRRGLLLVAVAVASALSVVLLLPALADLPETWERLRSGDGRWLLLALGFEAVSFLGHILLFRAVSRDASPKVTLRASTEITLAGHAATRLFASAGAGGVALTAWALRRSGMDRATVAARMTTFLVLLYSVYMLALLVGGIGLYAGVLPGSAPLGLTLVPAAFGGLVILVALMLPRLAGTLAGRPRLARVAPAAQAIGDGVHESLRMIRRADPGLVGALLWWAADIAVLWACFNAFGAAPALAVVVMAYFVGMLANTLPLPGGIGGVDGGMIGALIAFGVEPSLALVAVVAYRGFAFWLPILPGAAAWVSLRRTVASWGEPDVVEPATAAPSAVPHPVQPAAAPARTAPRHPAAPARARRPVAVAA